MNQEDKDLLLKDLSARLPYGVKVQYQVGSQSPNIKIFNARQYDELRNGSYIDDWLKCTFKPYLFPLSSITEEQREEYHNLCSIGTDECGDIIYFDTYESIDYLNKNKFDYRYLIPMGLAIDATGLNIY